MTKRNTTQQPTADDLRARKIKLAEGGIIMALIVSLCVFLGIHFAHDGDEPVAAMVPLNDAPPTEVAEVPAAVVASTPSPTAEDGTEPVAVVAPEATSAVSEEATPITEIVPEELPLHVTYAVCEQAFADGRYGDAARMFSHYCDEHPTNAWGHYMLGLSLWKADRDADAVTAFQAALEQKPDHLKSLVNLARVQLELDQPEAALMSVELALDVAPENVDARRVLGRTYHNLGRLKESADAYTQALRLKGDDAWSLNNLALVRIEQEQFMEALPALARAAELAPEQAVILNNLGTALEASGYLSQAAEQYELAAGLGSGKSEESLARLDAVIVPDDEPMADLPALAAAWSLETAAEAALDPAAPTVDDVALGEIDE